jgi:arabinofuranosyltransferase
MTGVVAGILICVCSYVAWRLLNRPHTGIDDADIFLVYARNFVHGHGIVYNVGGEHVEGVSSLPFFLLCSAAYAISSSPEHILFAANLLFAILTALCILSTLSSITDSLALPRGTYLLYAAAYFLWVGANPLYFAWNVVALMDAGIYSLVITAGFALLARMTLRASTPTRKQTVWLAILIGLTIVVRPEGLLWAPLEFAAFAWISLTQTPTRRVALANLRVPLAALILTPTALTLFRLRYFGYPLPNTFYAKVSGSLYHTIGGGLRYFHLFTDLYGITIYFPLMIAIVWLAYKLAKRRPHTTLRTFIGLATIFSFVALVTPIVEGGEHFRSFRMYQSVWPLLFMSLILPAVIFFRRLLYQFGYFFALALVIGTTSHCSWRSFASNNRAKLAPTNRAVSLELYFRIGSIGRDNGRRTHELFEERPPSVGFIAAGGFAYGYDGHVDDLVGLNDVRMAHADSVKTGPKDHQSFNRAVFFQEAPQLLLPLTMPNVSYSDLPNFVGDSLSRTSRNNIILKNIFNDPLFQATYTPAIIASDKHPGILCLSYVKNTYLQSLAADKAIHLTFLPGHIPPDLTPSSNP